MPISTPSAVRHQINARQTDPIYLLFGDDEAGKASLAAAFAEVVEEELFPGERDVVLDVIATPTRTLEINRQTPRPARIDWQRLMQTEIDAMPPLRELQRALGLA